MRVSKRVGVILFLVLLVGCAPKNYPPELVPAAQRLDAIHKINELMNTAIELESKALIPTDAARVIVKFCVVADQTIQAGAEGWKANLKVAWANVKTDKFVGPLIVGLWQQTAFAAVDAFIGAL